MMEGLFEDADGEKDKEDEVEARNSSTGTAEGMVTVGKEKSINSKDKANVKAASCSLFFCSSSCFKANVSISSRSWKTSLMSKTLSLRQRANT